MTKAIKWFFIVVGGLVALVVIALLAIPMFVDFRDYKPRVEKMISDAAGRPFSIDGDIDLSLFPWVGFSAADVHMGNPPGFEGKEFASVKSIEVRVKLIPLLSKDIQVNRFIVEGPRILVEKNKSGRTNLEGLGKKGGEATPAPKGEKGRETAGRAEKALPIKGLEVGDFAVTKGSLIWVDHGLGERKEISDITLRLEDVSLDRPISLVFSAMLDGRPIEAKGHLGPLGKEPGNGTIPLDLQVKALKELEMNLKGKVVDPATSQRFDLAVQVAPFSPRNLLQAVGQPFPVKTADPSALTKVGLRANLKGDPKQVSISDGVLDLDDSKLQFSARAKDFSRPDVAFDLALDRIDLDRYLPPPSEEKGGGGQGETKPSGGTEGKKTDYGPLRKLVLDGAIKIGELKAHGAKMEDLSLKLSARNGLLNLNPLTLKLYQGNLSSTGSLDVRQEVPQTKMALQVNGVKVNPLLKDLLKKDFLEGTFKGTMDLAMSGEDAERVKQSLNGKGDLVFTDGAIVGVDIPAMVRNVKANFGLAEKGSERPRTDFSELRIPFTISNGVVDTRETSLSSPLLRVLVTGKADLVKESLDFRVEPKFVGTFKGQGDKKERAGLTVPVLVAGSFSSPTFRPDLEGMLKGTLEKGIPDASELKKLFPGQPSQPGGTGQPPQPGDTGQPKPPEDKAKDLLKGLLGR